MCNIFGSSFLYLDFNERYMQAWIVYIKINVKNDFSEMYPNHLTVALSLKQWNFASNGQSCLKWPHHMFL